MNSRQECFSIVCASDPWGFNEESFFGIRDIFIESKPDYWEYLNPGSLLAYFNSTHDGSNRAHSLVTKLRELKASAPLYIETGIGSSEGELLVSYSDSGNILNSPLGMAISQAMTMARGIAQ